MKNKKAKNTKTEREKKVKMLSETAQECRDADASEGGEERKWQKKVRGEEDAEGRRRSRRRNRNRRWNGRRVEKHEQEEVKWRKNRKGGGECERDRDRDEGCGCMGKNRGR